MTKPARRCYIDRDDHDFDFGRRLSGNRGRHAGAFTARRPGRLPVHCRLRDAWSPDGRARPRREQRRQRLKLSAREGERIAPNRRCYVGAHWQRFVDTSDRRRGSRQIGQRQERKRCCGARHKGSSQWENRVKRQHGFRSTQELSFGFTPVLRSTQWRRAHRGGGGSDRGTEAAGLGYAG